MNNNYKMVKELNTITNEFFIEVDNNDDIIINAFKNENSSTNSLLGNVFINSKKIEIPNDNKKVCSYTSVNNGHIHIFIDIEDNKKDFWFELIIKNIKKEEKYKIVYTYDKEEFCNSSKSLGLNTDNASFMLLRTNPKLTGNIKLIVDSNDKMYLDTFEINSILSDKKYKHKEVSSDSNYFNDVRNVFSSMPTTQLFEISSNNYNLFSIKNKLFEQYDDTYFYGVKTNTNRLYLEDFSLLAPLYINNNIPDYFIIFKLDGPIESDISFNNATERLNYFMKTGKIIKSYNLKKNSPIGTYLRKIATENENINGSIYISMDNYNRNKWSGISIQKGIMTTIEESSFEIGKIKNQVDYDRFITNGFERNGLLNSNLINLEFMFNDKDAKSFEINRYFGLYVSNIELEKFVYDNETKEILIADEKISLNDFIDKYSFINEKEEIIFNLTYDNNFIQIKNNNDLKEEIEKIKNNRKNIFSTKIKKNNITSSKCCMHLTINEPLLSGEHFRIIEKNNKKVYEVVIGKVNDKKYSNVEDFYNYENTPSLNYNNDIIIYRNIAPGFDGENDKLLFNCNKKEDIIKKQISFIIKSFKSILSNNYEISYNNNEIFISSYNEEDVLFERISGNILYDDEKYKNIEKEKKEVTYFGIEIDNILLKPSISLDDIFIFQPINFEAWNNRNGYIIDFLRLDNESLLYDIPVQNYKDSINSDYIYINKEYKKLQNFNLYFYSDVEKEVKSIKSHKVLKSNNINFYIIKVDKNSKENYEEDNLISEIGFYKNDYIKLNISGIHSIKDFNFNVLDKTGDISFSNEKFTFDGKDEYDVELSNKDISFDAIRDSSFSCEYIENYFDLRKDIKENTKKIDTSIYYNSKRKMDIPLVTPINCKWNIVGKDVTNKKIKSTIFFNSLKKDVYSYRLVEDKEDSSIFGFPSGTLEDDMLYISNDFHEYKESILNNNGNIFQFINDSNKFTKLFYNHNAKKLEAIIFGKKINIYIDKIDLSQFNNYLFSIICVNNRGLNTTPIEFIFDKNNKVCLCVWYFNNPTDFANRNEKNKKLNSEVSISTENNSFIFNPVNKDIEGKKVFISFLNNNDYYIYNKEKTTYEFAAKVNEDKINSSDGVYLSSKELDNSFINKDVSILSKNNNSGIIYILDENNISNEYNISNFIISANKPNNFYIIENNNKIFGNAEMEIKIVDSKSISDSLSFILDSSKKSYVYDNFLEPDFINIVEFNNSDMVDDNNFFFDNLSIKNVNNIKQLWYNKVYENKEYDSSNYNTPISIQVKNDVDITKSCWSDDFYRMYKSYDGSSYIVEGYKSNKDVKFFFGSHAICLKNNKDKKDEIVIRKWSEYAIIETIKNYNNFDDFKEKNVISINLSTTLKDYIKNNTSYLNNWKNYKDNINYNDSYLDSLLSIFYSINNKNTIKFYKRKRTSNSILVPYEEQQNFIEVKNIKNEIIKKEDRYLLNVEIPVDEYEYAIKYTIIK